MQSHRVLATSTAFPSCLLRIASPPKQIFWSGQELTEILKRPRLAIVGSRSVSAYGHLVTLELTQKLAEQGIVIISGLALGVDALAHRAALEANGLTIAVLPSSLDKFYPATNAALGVRILEQGGTIITEYASGESFAFKQNFIARNRIIAGLADAVLITEAAEKSGSLHTARFALESGKEVLAVPGNITSPGSVGTNNLIKAGATPITSYEDVLHAMGLIEFKPRRAPLKGRTLHEQVILDLLVSGLYDGQGLLTQSNLSVSDFNRALTMLEVGGKVRSLGGNQWSLR